MAVDTLMQVASENGPLVIRVGRFHIVSSLFWQSGGILTHCARVQDAPWHCCQFGNAVSCNKVSQL